MEIINIPEQDNEIELCLCVAQIPPCMHGLAFLSFFKTHAHRPEGTQKPAIITLNYFYPILVTIKHT